MAVERVGVRIFSSDRDWSAEYARQLAPVEDIYVNGVGATDRDSAGAPAVWLVDGGGDPAEVLTAVAGMLRQHPTSVFVLVLRQGTAEAIYPRAALAGIRMVLPAGSDLAQLCEAIYQAAAHLGPADPAVAAGAGAQVHTVFGTKGGVGRTTVAVDLACLAAARGWRTALIDLHLDFGNVGIHLRVQAPRPYRDLLAESRHLDPDLLQSFMSPRGPHLWVLPAPTKPEVAEFVRPEHVRAVLEAARGAFDFVFLDTPPGFPETLLPALEETDHLLVLTTPDVPTLRNTRAGLAALELLQLGRAKPHLVLNRANRGAGVRRGDVETTLDLPVWAELPLDPAALVAANSGVAVTEGAPGSRLGRALQALGRLVAPEARTGLAPRRARRRTLPSGVHG